MSATPIKHNWQTIIGKNTDFSDTIGKDIDSQIDSTQSAVLNIVQYISSTRSATISFGPVTRARYVFIKTNVNGRIIINSSASNATRIPLRAGSTSSAFFHFKGSATAIRLINSTTARARYEVKLIGT